MLPVVDDGGAVKLFHGSYDAEKKKHFSLATSSDGLHWERRPLGLKAFQGNKNNNILPIEAVEASVFLDPHAPDAIKSLLGGPADVVLSDMAANATGHRQTDHLRIMALAEAAADFGREVLAPGGAFLCKVLQGGTETTLLAALKRDFASVKHVKPSASRADSAELYLLATGFRGQSS